ncbi:hypothetical protein [Mycoplasma procyoni]|uniref:hypothetical protein n=1 Tax=Mycoplasma procyoni TaxID=568784 RepID=UPI00197C6B5A|nr:hypothetical protein [Mycoplasma procyoni]MBN3535069.1 hypothetical protein [Mycoplasma procyoni]
MKKTQFLKLIISFAIIPLFSQVVVSCSDEEKNYKAIYLLKSTLKRDNLFDLSFKEAFLISDYYSFNLSSINESGSIDEYDYNKEKSNNKKPFIESLKGLLQRETNNKNLSYYSENTENSLYLEDYIPYEVFWIKKGIIDTNNDYLLINLFEIAISDLERNDNSKDKKYWINQLNLDLKNFQFIYEKRHSTIPTYDQKTYNIYQTKFKQSDPKTQNDYTITITTKSFVLTEEEFQNIIDNHNKNSFFSLGQTEANKN